MDYKTMSIILAAMALVAAIAGVSIHLKSKRGTAKVGSEKGASDGMSAPKNHGLTKRELADRENERMHRLAVLHEAIQASRDGVSVDINDIHTKPSSTQQQMKRSRV